MGRQLSHPRGGSDAHSSAKGEAPGANPGGDTQRRPSSVAEVEMHPTFNREDAGAAPVGGTN